MGIIDLYRYDFFDVSNGNEIKYKKEIVYNGLVFSSNFLKNLKWKKARNSFKCCICDKQKPKYSRYLGERYQQICSNCATEWFEKSVIELQETIELLNRSKKQLEDNSKVWRKEQILGGVS